MPFVALITGGGTGIGRAQALALSRIEGDDDGAAAIIIITGLRSSADALEATRREIGQDRCHALAGCDAGRTEDWRRIASKVESLGGALHFVGNTAGAFRAFTRYEDMDPEDLIAYNTSYITGVQLSYHYLVPYLIRGAEARGLPSVVVNMSSHVSHANRGLASMTPEYYTCKCAVDAVTRTAFGLYDGKGVVSYGVAPWVYTTDMVTSALGTFGMTLEQFCAFNPFPVEGDPKDIGTLTAALARGETGFESGATYNVFPVPPQFRDADDPDGSGSVAYPAALHGGDVDEVGWDGIRLALTRISKAWYSSGKDVPEDMLEKIRRGLAESRLAALESEQASAQG
jgi:NAD(P)-dependent dehydrogenase (short-subunit alcohol dehydrogenase family)